MAFARGRGGVRLCAAAAGRDSVGAIGAARTEAILTLTEAETVDPLAPVDTAGPRETLADLLARVAQIQSVFRVTIAS